MEVTEVMNVAEASIADSVSALAPLLEERPVPPVPQEQLVLPPSQYDVPSVPEPQDMQLHEPINETLLGEAPVLAGEDREEGADATTKGPGAPAGTKRGRDSLTEDKDGEKRWAGWPGDNVFRLVVPVQKVGGYYWTQRRVCEENVRRNALPHQDP